MSDGYCTMSGCHLSELVQSGLYQICVIFKGEGLHLNLLKTLIVNRNEGHDKIHYLKDK